MIHLIICILMIIFYKERKQKVMTHLPLIHTDQRHLHTFCVRNLLYQNFSIIKDDIQPISIIFLRS